MRSYANTLAPHSIRVNSVHPTGVRTPMVVNEVMQQFLESDPAMGQAMANALPVDMVEPVDISNAILWLVSDDGRYVTGITVPVDARLHQQEVRGQHDQETDMAGRGSRQGRFHHRGGPRPGPQPRGPAGAGGRGHHRGGHLRATTPRVGYAMATEADLAETVKEVEALDRRIVATQADVRDYAALQGRGGRRRRPAGPAGHRLRQRRHRHRRRPGTR